MTNSRLPLLAVVLFGAAAYTCAQQSGAPDLEQLSAADAFALTPQWLVTGNPRQRAWAAYWIGRDRQELEIPLLLDALENYEGSTAARSSNWSDDDAALLAVLDTLIQLNADVSPDLAETLYAKFPAPTLILLARSREDARQALLKILDNTKSRTDWLAAADMLAANPPPGFGARLLSAISIRAAIQLLSPGQAGVGGGVGGDCAGSLGDGPRQDWPPVGAHRLSLQPASGSELLVAGENPVYFTRGLTRDYSRGAHSSWDCADWFGVSISDLSRDLIGQLLGAKKDAFLLQLGPQLDITWESARSYSDAVTAFVLQQEQILHNTEAGLKARGLLSNVEAASIRPPFEVEIVDVRLDKAPLPDLAFADPSITVTHRNADSDPPE